MNNFSIEMYSKFVLGQFLKLVGKWPMADCYFRLCNRVSQSSFKSFAICTTHSASVKRYQQSEIGTVFQFGIAVRLQYCDNWQFGIHDVA